MLTDVQHENAKIVTSTIHIHLDAKNCLKIDVVCGSAQGLWSFAEKMIGAERSFSSSDVCHAGAESWHSGDERVQNPADLTNQRCVGRSEQMKDSTIFITERGIEPYLRNVRL